MKYLSIILILAFSTLCFAEDQYEGDIQFQIEAFKGLRVGSFSFHRLNPTKPVRWEYKLFKRPTLNDEWAEELSDLGLDGWMAVPSIYWGFGVIKIILMREIIENE